MFDTNNDLFSASIEGDVFFPFYSNYLSYEAQKSYDYEPHERLTYFYLAIQELVSAGKHALAFGIYQDLLQEKHAFLDAKDPCQEEVKDMLNDIVLVLRRAGIFATRADFSVEQNRRM